MHVVGKSPFPLPIIYLNCATVFVTTLYHPTGNRRLHDPGVEFIRMRYENAMPAVQAELDRMSLGPARLLLSLDTFRGLISSGTSRTADEGSARRQIAFYEPIACQQSIEKQQNKRTCGGYDKAYQADRRDVFALVEIRQGAAADNGAPYAHRQGNHCSAGITAWHNSLGQ